MLQNTYCRSDGFFLLVLHAHLPFIRYPEHDHHLEERWLFEAITESYIPLINTFHNLLNDKIDFRVTLSLTPTLIEMFNDHLLRDRYQRYLSSLLDLSEKEIFRTRKDRTLRVLSKMYRERFLKIRHLYEEVCGKDLTSSFKSLTSSGKVEIIAGAATHAYLPALMSEPAAARAQVVLGAEHCKKSIGKAPEGMWLPECGFSPGIDTFVGEAGMHFFFLENHGTLHNSTESNCCSYCPVATPSGVVVFSRDTESSWQVWSSEGGYPGDSDYRDFYRDIGFDLDQSYLQPYLPEGVRTFTGIKYHRITGRSINKKPYIYSKALRKTELHAEHFIASKKTQILRLNETLQSRPLIVAAYDAELFGHWWFEGPEWLNYFLRKGAEGKGAFRFITPSEFLSLNPNIERVNPSLSSWGEKGYSSTWLNDSNDWTYRHLHKAATLMVEMATRRNNAQGLIRRALNQAARELLLAQASDWTFMMHTGTSSEFAKTKFVEHVNNFLTLQSAIQSGMINKQELMLLEANNNIFSDIDYRIYRKR